jgi:hypothetical protein
MTRPQMTWPNFRELLPWALFATVTAVHLHSRAQLELCMTQRKIALADLRDTTTFPSGQDSGPREQDEPSGAVGFVGAPARRSPHSRQRTCRTPHPLQPASKRLHNQLKHALFALALLLLPDSVPAVPAESTYGAGSFVDLAVTQRQLLQTGCARTTQRILWLVSFTLLPFLRLAVDVVVAAIGAMGWVLRRMLREHHGE